MALTIEVTSAEELDAALRAATGGETIRLAGGDYGALTLSGSSSGLYQFDTPVTIQSADVGDPAVFASVDLSRVEGLTFDGVVFDYDAAPGAAINERLVDIAHSKDVAIKNSQFVGDVAEGVDAVSDGYATGVGLNVDSSEGVEIAGNEFSSFLRGAVFWRTDDLSVTTNDVHSMRSDGFNFADVDDVLIEANHLHDFESAPDSSDHRDFIQFWTTSTTSPSTNVVIRGNVLDMGDGDWTQSIFIRNEQVDRGDAGHEMFYRNFLIEDNLIQNGHLHGIKVGQVDGAVIRNNAVVDSQSDDGSGSAPSIRVDEDALNVSILNNITHNVIAPEGAEVDGNLIIDVDDHETLNALFADPSSDDASADDAPAEEATGDAAPIGPSLLHTLTQVVNEAANTAVPADAEAPPAEASSSPEAAAAGQSSDGPIVVDDADALLAALRAAEGGETIFLEAGDYGDLMLRDLPTYVDAVTIASLDEDAAASFTSLYVKGSSNLSFVSIDVGGPDADKTSLVTILDAADIAFADVVFDGSALSDASIGLNVKRASDVSVDGGAFVDLGRGVVARDSEGVTVSETTFSGLSRDGVSFVDSSDVAVVDSVLRDFEGDRNLTMIRVDETKADGAVEDVLISGNVLDASEGSNVRGVALRSSGEEGFDGVEISDNVIATNERFGVIVDDAADAAVEGNVLIAADGAEQPTIVVMGDASTVTLERNASSNDGDYDLDAVFEWLATDAPANDVDAIDAGYALAASAFGDLVTPAVEPVVDETADVASGLSDYDL